MNVFRKHALTTTLILITMTTLLFTTPTGAAKLKIPKKTTSKTADTGCGESCIDYTPGYIVLPAESADDPGLRFAASQLAAAMKDLYATAPEIISDKQFTSEHGAEPLIIVGENNSLVEKLNAGNLLYKKANALGEESFQIAAGAAGAEPDRPVIVIHGGGIRGCAYALIHLAERLRLDPRSVFTIKLFREPVFPLRMVSGDTTENALLLGYNTYVSNMDFNRAILFKDYDIGLFATSSMRLYIMAWRDKLAEQIKLDKGYHLDTVASSDELEFPRAILKRPYADKLTGDDKNPERLCTCSEELWSMYGDKYRELLTDFPDLDYTMIRIGENYAAGDYFGTMPAKKEPWEDCPKCIGPGNLYQDRVAKLINTSQAVISGEMKHKYIQRTWDTNSDTFHSNPKMYRAILDRIDNKDNFYFSVKHTKTDFWRYNFPNETIGLGDPSRQIVEFQCAREYEGKGAFPNYIGEELAKAYLYTMDRGARGVWNWHHGGGWNGPTLKTDIWNQANIYAASHLAWDPHTPADVLAREWAVLNFGRENADAIVKILMKSDDAVLKLVYFQAYAEKKGNPWMPNENWVRDDEIKGAEPLRKIYSLAAKDVDSMIAEKEEGVHVVESMYLTARTLTVPEEMKKTIVDTIYYEVLLSRVLRDYAASFFHYCRWRDTGKAGDRKTALLYARQWSGSWSAYTGEIVNLKWAATPYRDNGMVDTMKKISAELEKIR